MRCYRNVSSFLSFFLFVYVCVAEGALRSPQQATAVVATATTAATTAGPVRCGLCGARVGATLAARPRERRLEDATGAKGDEVSNTSCLALHVFLCLVI